MTHTEIIQQAGIISLLLLGSVALWVAPNEEQLKKYGRDVLIFMGIYLLFLVLIRELSYFKLITVNASRIVNGLGSFIPLIGAFYVVLVKRYK